MYELEYRFWRSERWFITNQTDQEATMGFELSLNDILVERLISLFPDIDTLVPMLRSFEAW